MKFLVGTIVSFKILAVALAASLVALSGELQQHFDHSPQVWPSERFRKLKGKILHISDLHPDPFYNVGSAAVSDHPCHEGSGYDETGIYGAPGTSCDTPFTLVDATFKWIEEHVRDEVDFVIWTGDSARHDNDDHIPRSTKQVQQLNQYIVQKFTETFGQRSGDPGTGPVSKFVVPIIPTIGNNDILPHNIFMPGPNTWTRFFLDIWGDLIPEEQQHSFARGGWFWTEVIPSKLAVISMNTLYFFEKNSATFGCDIRSEPGYEQMEWLRTQLQFMRERGLKVFLTGHIPPSQTKSKKAWDESCYQKYILWQKQYRDIIVANLFGHMNIDHFMFHDINDLIYKIKIDDVDEAPGTLGGDKAVAPLDDRYRTTQQTNYLKELRAQWSELPVPPKGISYSCATDISVLKNKKKKKKKHKQLKKFLKDIGGPYGERFSMSITSPSVVPNYFPSLRILEYNTTGLGHDQPAAQPLRQHLSAVENFDSYRFPELQEEVGSVGPHQLANVANLDIEEKKTTTTTTMTKKDKKKKKKHKDGKVSPDFPVPIPPAKSSPPGPAYSPQTFSLLSWTQLYANLTSIHEQITRDDRSASDSGPDSSHLGKGAHFGYKIEYSTHDDVYNLPDLTMRHWLGLASKIGQSIYEPAHTDIDCSTEDIPDHGQLGGIHEYKNHKKEKAHGKLKDNRLWYEFVKRAFVGVKSDTYLEDEFG